MFFVTGLFWSSWRSERMKRGRSQTGVSKAITSPEVVLVGYLSVVAPRRRLLPLTCLRPPPPCNQSCSCTAAIQKTVSESALFPSAVKVTHCRGHRLSLYLLAAMRRCVTAGLKELINELTNQLEGWSVSGLQTPAEGHQFIPGQTEGVKVVRTTLRSGRRLTIAYIWGGAKSGRVMWKPSWIIL